MQTTIDEVNRHITSSCMAVVDYCTGTTEAEVGAGEMRLVIDHRAIDHHAHRICCRGTKARHKRMLFHGLLQH